MKKTIENAVHNRNALAAGRVSGYLRFKYNATYEQTYHFVNDVAPISREDWEALLYEIDR